MTRLLQHILRDGAWLAIVALSVVCIPVAHARADLLVEISGRSLAAGGSGYIDVWISSEDVDSLFLFNYEFAISSSSSNIGTLRFANPQSDFEAEHSSYIFSPQLGGSGGFSSITQNGPFYDSLQGGDFVATGQDISIYGSKRLLVQLDVEHIVPQGLPVNSSIFTDQFMVHLVDSDNTFFMDANSSMKTISAASFDQAGVVTITVIPEPSHSAILLVVVGCCSALRVRQHRSTNSLALLLAKPGTSQTSEILPFG